MAEKHHVVVDGSNLATEGRTLPSLRQLDEAVRAYAEEDPGAEIVVVVDASFEHRIDSSERKQLEQAELHGEVVSPPAGAIGRGDAFVLRIAERTGAKVLSNDSFQEFHGEHPWLFDDGRLVGGKPVPGVGWIFTPRIPVRGPKSRQATGKANREASRAASLPAPVKAAELARAAKKVAARRAATMPDGSAPKIGDVWEPDTSAPAKKARKAAKAPKKAVPAAVEAPKTASKEPAKKATKAAKKAQPAAKATKATKATKTASKEPAKKATKAAKAAKKAQPAAKATKATKATKTASKEPAKKATKAAKKATVSKAVKKVAEKAINKRTVAKQAALPVLPAESGAGTSAGGAVSRRAGRRPEVDPQLLEAIDEATAEALSPPAPAEPKGGKAKSGGRNGKDGGKAKSGSKDGKLGKSGSKGTKRRRASTPPPAVNEPLAFITFVATYPLGSEVEGEVASFTSHGAMVEVSLPEGGGLYCYIPLAGLGDPPPHKAREVLARGERRTFVLVSLDPPRRVAELALPGVVPRALAGSSLGA